MRRLALLAVTVLLFGRPALAQDASRGEVSGGWRFYHANRGNLPFMFDVKKPNEYPRGWYGDIALNLSPKFAIVGEAGGSYFSADAHRPSGSVTFDESAEVTFHTFMGGIRVRAPQNARLVPFGQVLVGGEHNASNDERTITFSGRPSTSVSETSGSGAVLALDGGLTIAAAGSLGVRASAGYVRFFSKADADAFRLALGATLRF